MPKLLSEIGFWIVVVTLLLVAVAMLLNVIAGAQCRSSLPIGYDPNQTITYHGVWIAVYKMPDGKTKTFGGSYESVQLATEPRLVGAWHRITMDK